MAPRSKDAKVGGSVGGELPLPLPEPEASSVASMLLEERGVRVINGLRKIGVNSIPARWCSGAAIPPKMGFSSLNSALLLLFSLLPSALPACLQNCSLNGVCDDPSQSCICDPSWEGPACTTLRLAPTTASSGLHDSANGTHLSTWGGSVIVDNDGVFHMWAARMTHHCGIGSWLSNSEIVHATSPSPTGAFVTDSVVWGVWAHEPTVMRAPTGEFVMLWTGNNGTGPLPVRGGQQCACLDGSTPPTCTTGRNWSIPLLTYMSYAVFPAGPWSPPLLIPSVAPLIDTNMAGVILSNGTFVGLWRDNSGQTPGPSALHRVVAADWRQPATYVEDGAYQLNEEDPTVWFDLRGGLHVLTHAGCQGRHGFSSDGGLNWQYSAQGNGIAFGCGIELINGTQLRVRRRERPHAVLDAKGRLVAITSAVQPVDAAGGDLTFTTSVPVAAA